MSALWTGKFRTAGLFGRRLEVELDRGSSYNDDPILLKPRYYWAKVDQKALQLMCDQMYLLRRHCTAEPFNFPAAELIK